MGSAISSIVFQPPPPFGPTRIQNKNRELIWLTTKDEHFIPALHVQRENAVYTILYSHGNAESLGRIVGNMYALANELNVNVFTYEYSCYPWTHKKATPDAQPDEAFFNIPSNIDAASEQYCFNNIDAAWSYLVDTAGVPPNRIILHGRSLGSGPTTYLAQRVQARALILESAFMSCYRVKLPFTLPSDLFLNLERMPFITCSTLIVHGTNDMTINYAHGKGLYAASASTHKQMVTLENADHNNIQSVQVNRTNYFNGMRSFFFELIDQDFPSVGSSSAWSSSDDSIL